MPTLIAVEELSYRAPDGRLLFENLTLTFGPERTGLVGRNGVGKTTLLRLILAELEPLAGVVRRRGRIAVLRQALAPPPGATVADLLGVSGALARLGRLETGAGTDEDFAEADWNLQARLDAELARVGLEGMAPARAAADLSGGQITRAALAAALLQAPDVLLLDEPTNNLDEAARELVGEVLEDWTGAAVVISHDRGLLRRMDRIVELTTLGAQSYGGGYDLYLTRKAEEEASARRALDTAALEAGRVEREVQIARERKARKDAAGRRSRAKGDAPKMLLDARAERAEASMGGMNRLAGRRRAETAEALEAARSRVEQVRRLAVALPPSNLAAGKTVLDVEAVGFDYGHGPPILDGLSFRLVGPERVAVAGPNGAGKTTLLRLAAGELEPSRGRAALHVPALMLDQKAAILRDDESLLRAFRRLNPEADDNGARAAQARFLFRGETVLKPAGALSGGERLRAALACVLVRPRPPQLLILDEPTNHLDLDSIAAIEQALAAYDGALLVVSHDQAFLEAIRIERRLDLGGA